MWGTDRAVVTPLDLPWSLGSAVWGRQGRWLCGGWTGFVVRCRLAHQLQLHAGEHRVLAVQIFDQGHTPRFLCKGLQMRRMRGAQARHLVRVQARVATEQWLEQTAGGIATVQFGLERHRHHRGLSRRPTQTVASGGRLRLSGSPSATGDGCPVEHFVDRDAQAWPVSVRLSHPRRRPAVRDSSCAHVELHHIGRQAWSARHPAHGKAKRGGSTQRLLIGRPPVCPSPRCRSQDAPAKPVDRGASAR